MKYVLLVLLLLLSGPAKAAAVATASQGDVTITLYDDKCALPAVSNLPFRATWRDATGLHDGCFDVANGLVLAYFADKTVVAIPARVFKLTVGV